MGDNLDMDTDPVVEAASRLQTSGETLSTSWMAARSRIFGSEGPAIGTGRLADAFRGTYEDPAMTARENANPYPTHITDLAKETTGAAGRYLSTDDGTHMLFQRLVQGEG